MVYGMEALGCLFVCGNLSDDQRLEMILAELFS